MRIDAPFDVACASCCAGDQYRASATSTCEIVTGGSPVRASRRLERDLELQRRDPRSLRAQVGRGRRVLRRGEPGHERGRERVERNEPRRDRRHERLAEERPERLVLERLDVAGRPVVDEQQPEHVRDRRRRSRSARRGDSPCRPRNRVPTRCPAACSGATRPPRLAVTRPEGRTTSVSRHDDGARPAVVADGHVPPVREQRFTLGPEEPSEVRRVVDPRVHVDVVAHGDGQLQLQLIAPHDEVSVDRRARHRADDLAHVRAHASRPRREEVIEARLREHRRRRADVGARSRRRADRARGRRSPRTPAVRSRRYDRSPNGRFAIVKSESAGIPVSIVTYLEVPPGSSVTALRGSRGGPARLDRLEQRLEVAFAEAASRRDAG